MNEWSYLVLISVDDEDKVEFFEITNPSGKKHLFSKFEDGMVVFKHPGLAEAGIWSYHAKLYPNSGLMGSGNKMTVDVVSRANNAEAAPVVMEVFTSVHQADEVRQFKISGNLFIKKAAIKFRKIAFNAQASQVLAVIFVCATKRGTGNQLKGALHEAVIN